MMPREPLGGGACPLQKRTAAEDSPAGSHANAYTHIHIHTYTHTSTCAAPHPATSAHRVPRSAQRRYWCEWLAFHSFNFGSWSMAQCRAHSFGKESLMYVCGTPSMTPLESQPTARHSAISATLHAL